MRGLFFDEAPVAGPFCVVGAARHRGYAARMPPSPDRSPDPDARFKTALQILAILGLAGVAATVFHKAFADLGLLWQQHSGADFWAAFARYVFKNLAGG